MGSKPVGFVKAVFPMKLMTYHQLDGCTKAAARQRVCGVLDKMARESGRICVETAAEVARRARFSVNKQGHIWGIELPADARYLS